jgi:hypothetical protein
MKNCAHLIARPIPVVVLCAMTCYLSITHVSNAADYELKPRIVVSEEFNDNINERSSATKDEFITRAQPGFSLVYKAPVLDLNMSYNFDYRHYAKETRGDEYTHNLSSSGTLVVIDNLFFIQATDTYKQVSLDVTRDYTTDSLYLNQSDQNIGTVSPYFIWRLGSNSSIKTGYRYTNIWYKEPTGVDKKEHYAFADASHELLPKLSLTWGYSYSDTDTNSLKYQRHNAYGGFRYEYAEKSFLFGQGGHTWQSFNNGVMVSNPFWNAGLTHHSPVATATLETRVQYTEDPLRSSIKETLYSGKLMRSFARGSLDISSSYSEYVITETGAVDRKKVSVSSSGKYEIIDRLNLLLAIAGEQFLYKTTLDYTYKLNGNAGLLYSFNNNLNLSLNYYYITYRNQISNSSDSRDVNRAVLEFAKVF